MSPPIPQWTILALDCQTTGAAPPVGQVIELGWGIGRACDALPQSRAHLCSLSEGAALPRKVRQLTGLEEADLTAAGTILDAVGTLVDELASVNPWPVVAVAHFAAFERRFLDSLLEAALTPKPALRWLCTERLARWLVPGLPSYTLRAVAGHCGCPLPPQRRAADHVTATLEIWRRLAPLAAEVGPKDVDELIEMLATLGHAPSPLRTRRSLLPAQLRRQMPKGPGVYRFLDAAGQLLYVGKATCLRSRVGSYLGSPKGKAGHTREMLAQAADVHAELTRSVLEASLREVALIQELAPPYNRALRPVHRATPIPAPEPVDAQRIARGWIEGCRERDPEEPPADDEQALLLRDARHLARLWRRTVLARILRRCTVEWAPGPAGSPSQRRVLVVAAGRSLVARDLEPDDRAPEPPNEEELPLSPTLEREELDRIGVLMAELRRLAAEDRLVCVLLQSGLRVEAGRLNDVLRAVDGGP